MQMKKVLLSFFFGLLFSANIVWAQPPPPPPPPPLPKPAAATGSIVLLAAVTGPPPTASMVAGAAVDMIVDMPGTGEGADAAIHTGGSANGLLRGERNRHGTGAAIEGDRAAAG